MRLMRRQGGEKFFVRVDEWGLWPGARSKEQGARSQEPGARSQEPGARSQGTGDRGQGTGDRVGDASGWNEIRGENMRGTASDAYTHHADKEGCSDARCEEFKGCGDATHQN